MLKDIEAQQLENEFLANVASAAGKGGVLAAHFKQKWQEEQAAHQQTRDELAAERQKNTQLETLVRELSEKCEALKRSQVNYVFNEGAVNYDNSQNIQLMPQQDPSVPMLGAVL